jgi:hypothetical protein
MSLLYLFYYGKPEIITKGHLKKPLILRYSDFITHSFTISKFVVKNLKASSEGLLEVSLCVFLFGIQISQL